MGSGNRDKFGGTKAHLFLLAFWVCVAFLVGVMWFGVPAFGIEGTKVLKFADTSITVPSMAPDFTCPNWEAAMVGSEDYPGGSASMAMVINPGRNVRVIVLRVKPRSTGKLSVVAFCAEYPGKPMDFFEDYQYATTGKPSGVFVRCEGAVMERYSRWLKGSGI